MGNRITLICEAENAHLMADQCIFLCNRTANSIEFSSRHFDIKVAL